MNKQELHRYLSLSNKVSIDLIEESKKSYKIMIIGDKSKVKKSDFQEAVLEFIKEQKEFNKEQKNFNNRVIERLDNIEKRIEILESFHKDEL